MATSKNNFLDHVRCLRQAVLEKGGDLIITGDSMQALIRHGMTHWMLQPQFLATINGVTQYTPTFVDEASHFAGWLPYRNKRWPIANDKLTFKRFAESAGLRTPEFSSDPRADLSDVVVKRAASSFGAQVQGPFRSSRERMIDVAQGEYYERFVEGRLLKIWYWDAEPVCVELDNMPSVAGNGIATVGELMIRRVSMTKLQNDEDKQRLLDRSEALLRYFDVATTTVLAAQSRQIVEFRYGSDLMHQYDRKVIDLQTTALTPWMTSLRSIGQQLHGAIPDAERNGTAFTVDAVLDRQGEVWLLEMNSNPTIHPLVYPKLVASLMPAEPASPASDEQRSIPDSSRQQASIPQPA